LPGRPDEGEEKDKDLNVTEEGEEAEALGTSGVDGDAKEAEEVAVQDEEGVEAPQEDEAELTPDEQLQESLRGVLAAFLKKNGLMEAAEQLDEKVDFEGMSRDMMGIVKRHIKPALGAEGEDKLKAGDILTALLMAVFKALDFVVTQGFEAADKETH
jgi:hypothetical protein